MLQLRPSCECCDVDLPPDAPDARICSYECTFCAECVEQRLRGVCPNCGGEFVRRPRRPAHKLLKDPASTRRVFKPCQPVEPGRPSPSARLHEQPLSDGLRLPAPDLAAGSPGHAPASPGPTR